MIDSRIFKTSENGSVTAPAEIIRCATDEEAIERARAFVNGQSVEVWDGARQVISIPAAK
jgi:hypothetical protein